VLVSGPVGAGAPPRAVPTARRPSEPAVPHLVDLGHRRIAHVAGPPATTNGILRRAGFEEALAKRGLPHDESSVMVCDRYAIDEGERACTELLARDAGFTAIVAGNDTIALGCFDALARAGLRCPDDISVVGCNDMPFADRFN